MPDKSTVLVTGGAGYIGSHTVLQLRARGERVVVLDNLSTGFRQAVRDTPLVVGNVGDRELVRRSCSPSTGVDTVMHFAAHTIVPESVSRSAQVLRQQHLRHAHPAAMLRRRRASSISCSPPPPRSTASPPRAIADGGLAHRADQPYGTSKLMSEWMLRDLCAATPHALRRPALFQRGRLRSAGPHRPVDARRRRCSSRSPAKRPWASGRICRCSARTTPRPTAPASATTSTSRIWRPRTSMRSTTCATAASPLVAELRLRPRLQRARSAVSVERIAGLKLVVREEPRRAGDPPVLVASATRSATLLGWRPRLDDLDTIVRTSLDWEKRLQREPW